MTCEALINSINMIECESEDNLTLKSRTINEIIYSK